MRETGRSKPGVSLSDIAEAAGVSKMTVSRVLRDASGFSEETRVRVMQQAERLGYLPDKIAVAFGSDAASTLIGVCIPRLSSETFAQVLEGADRTLGRFGYQTIVGASDHSAADEETWVGAVLPWRPAGLILTGRRRSPKTLEMLRAAAIPLVEIWDLNARPLDMSVGFNHYDAGYEMGRFLSGRGRRRIGYVGVDQSLSTMAGARLDGFRDALTDAGLSPPEVHLLKDRPSFYAGYFGAEQILAHAPDLDLLYFHDDNMAIGGMMYCQSRGASVPDDIGIAGWGGMEATSVLPRRLTTTAVPRLKIGHTAAECIMKRLRGEAVADTIEVPFKLVPGGTV